MAIGEKISYIVDELEGGNKSNVARKIGIPGGKPTLIRDWIIGKSKPKDNYRRAIVDVYKNKGVTLDWLNSEIDTLPYHDELPNISEGDILIDRISKMDQDLLHIYTVTLRIDTQKTFGTSVIAYPIIQLDVMAENSRDAGVIAQTVAFKEFLGARYRITEVTVTPKDNVAINNNTMGQQLSSMQKYIQSIGDDVTELKSRLSTATSAATMPNMRA